MTGRIYRIFLILDVHVFRPFCPLKPLKTTVKEVLEVLLEVLEVALEVLEVALEVPGVLGPKIHVIKRSWYRDELLGIESYSLWAGFGLVWGWFWMVLGWLGGAVKLLSREPLVENHRL